MRSDFGDTARWLQEIRKYSPWIVGHFLAALIVSFYNGELGYHEKWFSKMYTCAYPVHMLIIGIIRVIAGI